RAAAKCASIQQTAAALRLSTLRLVSFGKGSAFTFGLDIVDNGRFEARDTCRKELFASPGISCTATHGRWHGGSSIWVNGMPSPVLPAAGWCRRPSSLANSVSG